MATWLYANVQTSLRYGVSQIQNMNCTSGLGSSTVLVLGTCTWYLYLSTYLSVLDVIEYLVYRNVKVLVLVLVLDQKVLGT